MNMLTELGVLRSLRWRTQGSVDGLLKERRILYFPLYVAHRISLVLYMLH